MTFKDFYEEYQYNEIGQIDESGAGIRRVVSRLKDAEAFAMISASRGIYSRKENRKRNNELIRELRTIFDLPKGFGAYKLVGHWKECRNETDLKEVFSPEDCPGEVVDEIEDSWLIIKPPQIGIFEFEKVIQKTAQKYNQDAYVWGENGKVFVKSKHGELWESLGKVSDKVLTKGFESVVNVQGYTQLKKDRAHGRVQNIVFKESFEIHLVVPKDNIASKRAFTSLGISY